MEVTLRAETGRETGSRPSRRLRRAGKVPAVVYGQGVDPVLVAVDAHDLYGALHTEAGVNAIINLEVEGGETHTTLAREIKRHPWRGTIDHVDFIKVSLTEKVVAEVLIDLTGTPEGVIVDGGIVETINNTVQVEALPADIPTSIPLDIAALGLGDVARVEDLPPIEGVEYLDEADLLIVTVTLPAAEVAAEEEEEELLEGEELEEAEEGEEAAPEGEGEPEAEAESE
ncbi:MAG: 50S ribosomal protein L25 [Acidimicrobiia bacterium]